MTLQERKGSEQRNRALVKRRDSDPIYWSFNRLGKKYKISSTTAFEIYHREKAKAAVKSGYKIIPIGSYIASRYKQIGSLARV